MKFLANCSNCKRFSFSLRKHKMYFKPINMTITGKAFLCRTCTRKIEAQLSEVIE